MRANRISVEIVWIPNTDIPTVVRCSEMVWSLTDKLLTWTIDSTNEQIFIFYFFEDQLGNISIVP